MAVTFEVENTRGARSTCSIRLMCKSTPATTEGTTYRYYELKAAYLSMDSSQPVAVRNQDNKPSAGYGFSTLARGC